MSIRALIGIVQALVTPGNRIAWSSPSGPYDELFPADAIGPEGAEDRLQPVRSPIRVPARPRPPLGLGLELDHGLHHRERRRIGGGLRPPRLPVHARHLGEGAQYSILRLQESGGLGDRDPRERGRHVEDGALVQGRHELRAEPPIDRDRRQERHDREPDHRPRMPEHEPGHRQIHAMEEPAHRMVFLAMDGAGRQPRSPPARAPAGGR